MPTYEYHCTTCDTIEEIIHSIKETPIVECSTCKASMERLISKNMAGFVIKGGTETMAWKEKRLRTKKNADLGIRQIDRYGTGPQLQPNVKGEEVSSWSEAAKLAKDKGLREDTYIPHIEKEKVISKSSGVNDAIWKKAKEAKDLA